MVGANQKIHVRETREPMLYRSPDIAQVFRLTCAIQGVYIETLPVRPK